jgi:transcriptional antiterminator Rof (Rho-off)
MKGKQHWMAIAAEEDALLLRLDKRSVRAFVMSFEARSKVNVETVQ